MMSGNLLGAQGAVVVVFKRPWELYFPGDTAAFALTTAQWLVRAGFATWPLPGR